MKNHLILLSICLMMAAGLLAQNPATPDTLTKKSASVSADTLKKEPVAQKPQEQPVKAKVRKDTRPLKDRIDFNLGTSFWVNKSSTFGQVSLLVSYRFPKILSLGAGPTYIFNYQRGSDQNLNGWGGIVFARAQLLKFFYLWTNYQGIDNQYIDQNSNTRDHTYVDSWFLGGGVNIRFGRRTGINLSVTYDVLYDKTYSPYINPVVYSVGFGF
ncbi:MAG: hypothetical protein NTW16_16865 [Bacteroidetes bacterium]|nr:hypothetical protein [Bacteroidota bacterium]